MEKLVIWSTEGSHRTNLLEVDGLDEDDHQVTLDYDYILTRWHVFLFMVNEQLWKYIKASEHINEQLTLKLFKSIEKTLMNT